LKLWRPAWRAGAIGVWNGTYRDCRTDPDPDPDAALATGGRCAQKGLEMFMKKSWANVAGRVNLRKPVKFFHGVGHAFPNSASQPLRS
jgi:hypothetical protein